MPTLDMARPDLCVRQEPNASDKFKEINKAYEALVDDEKRARCVCGNRDMDAVRCWLAWPTT